jgi:methionine-rich copper-binding protein CopC
MTWGRIVLLCLALLPLWGGEAGAHAWPDHAAPAVGSTVHAPPAEVRIWFTQELESVFSTIRVLDESGRQVDRNDAKVDETDRTLIKVSLTPLQPGVYKAIWRVLSVDTHVTEGDFTFRVAP